MDKLSYYLMGLKEGWFKDAFWVKSILSVFKTTVDTPYLIRTDEKGFYFHDKGSNKVYLTNTGKTNLPLFRIGEMIDIPKDYLPSGEAIRTSVGCLLQNYLLVIDPFGKRVPYINKRFFPSDVEQYFLPKWTRSKYHVTETEPVKEGEIFTEDFLVFTDNVLHLTNYTQTVVPSITEKSLRRNPELEKRKQELYKQYHGQLYDPVIAAQIDAELVKIDKDYLKDDESSGFLISGKAYANTRKRLNNHFGTTTGLDESNPKFIERSLRDGYDLTRLSDYVNDAYSGSIGRGLETQEGGVDVKDALRSAANLKVEGDDCGTQFGQPVDFPERKEKAFQYLGYWYMDEKKNSIQITEENLPSLLGKQITMRSPAMCVAKKSTMCKRCCGPNIGDYPNGIAVVNAQPGSIIMATFMKKMHNSSVSTTKWNDKLIS